MKTPLCYNHHKEVIIAKRDLDLIRKILLYIEDKPHRDRIYIDQLVENFNNEYSYETISYQIELLEDTYFIECDRIPSMGTLIDEFIIYRLTSYGHDYLDSIRDDEIYKETKTKFGKFLSSATLETISSVASKVFFIFNI